MKIKNIAVLTSGGDAPGMNSALYGVYTACKKNNINLYGVSKGYEGLIDDKFNVLDFDKFNGRISDGGSILKSSRSSRFLKNVHFKKAIKNIKKHNIEAIIIIGGDGSIKGAMELQKSGLKVASIPATIDNDLNFTFTLGYDTALNNIVNALDNISDSLNAFGYGCVVKIMGRDCNDLIDGAADAVYSTMIVKTKEINIDDIVKQAKHIHKQQELPPVVLVREDCVDVNELAKILEEKCKFPFRAHILGYIQRGGSPSAFDRKYGYTAGNEAVKAILNNERGFVVGIESNKLVKKPFENSLKS